jgi:hypothetical protein
MSEPRFIFETVDFQNGANTINNNVNAYNAQCNAAVTGNTFKFASDYDRMKNLLGSKGQTRNSGFYDGLYASLYALSITQPVLPSTSVASFGWGKQLWAGPIDPVLINDAYLQARAERTEYVGVQIAGYLYSPSNTTTTLQTVSDDGVIVNFNGTRVINNWTYHGPTIDTSTSLPVNAGYNPIQILFFEGAGSAQLDFNYQLPTAAAYTGNLKCNFFYNYNQM